MSGEAEDDAASALYGDDEQYEERALYADSPPRPPVQTDDSARRRDNNGAAENDGDDDEDDDDAVHYNTEVEAVADVAAPLQVQRAPPHVHSAAARSASTSSPLSPAAAAAASAAATAGSTGASQLNPRSVYCENLPIPLTDAELRAHFAPFGVVTAVHINVHMATGEQKGIGFVEFAAPEQATAAVRGTNQSPLRGRLIRTSIAKAKGVKSANSSARAAAGGALLGASAGTPGAMWSGAIGGGGVGVARGAGGAAERVVDPANLYVAGLPPSWSQDDVSQCFAAFGPVADCKLLVNLPTRESKGVAFVRFGSEQSAAAAIAALDGKAMEGGGALQVRVAHRGERKAPIPSLGSGMGMAMAPGGMPMLAMQASRMAGGMGGAMRPGMGWRGRHDGPHERRRHGHGHGHGGWGWEVGA